jgi:virginiamycin B lyase
MSKARLGSAVAMAAALAAAGAGAQELPPGAGRDIVVQACTGCHEARRIVYSGYTPAGWHNVVSMMLNVGAPIPPDKIGDVEAYLAQNFPERARPAAALVAGPVSVAITEWPVPTPGSRPHDPMAAPDGAIWYTGQMANVLGRLDPATGHFKEYKLPAMSGPHGLAMDANGKVWFTANFKAYIGRLDPATGEVAEYKMPDPQARDPHTLVFDRSGTLWFTVQGGDMVGRLEPATGAIKLVAVPTPRALPYGMAIDSHGHPFFDEFGANKIGRIDPATMAIREYRLPAADARPRRIAITADDAVWYTDYARGFLGRLDPATGKVEEWASPGGPRSQPYGMAALGDAIWYSESGVRPNTVVRLDTKTHQFQTWPIPSGGGVVRNMMATRDGKLALACSGVNGLALVAIK